MTDLTTQKSRKYLADHPTIDLYLPLKASTTIYEGMYCELASGAVDKVAGAGTFCGIALETKTGGASDGSELIKMRVQGAIEVGIADTIAITDVAAANSVEATDSDTLRLETGTAVTGTTVGKIARVVQVGASGTNRCVVSFKATALLA